ncbi:hypothetical protein EX30DRAFT_374833 [Ascodesmis nigricans]|uniref:DUF7514 domain-containing protein n=1 Tax=Ascodesmis nigricans TaxID=341454 RepID=A0A4S2MJQ4_9PEZI|nr:hypothetical protein EX30DRAFT_374833 [Ascodesmis nigricans]
MLKIITDSQSALRRIQSTEPGPGSNFLEDIREHHRKLKEAGIKTHLYWVPVHYGIEGKISVNIPSRPPLIDTVATRGEHLCDRCYTLKIHPTTHEIRHFRRERQKNGRPKRTTTSQISSTASVISDATESKDHDAQKPSDPSTRNAKDEVEGEKILTLASFYTLSGSPQPGAENITLLLITTDNIDNHNNMNLTNRLLANLYCHLFLEHTTVISTAAHRPRSSTPILTLRGFLALFVGHLRATPEKTIKILNSLLALIPSDCGPEIPRECTPHGAGDSRIHKVMVEL